MNQRGKMGHHVLDIIHYICANMVSFIMMKHLWGRLEKKSSIILYLLCCYLMHMPRHLYNSVHTY